MSASHSPQRPVRILFVCRGNTCRSVMAEGLARHKFGDTIEVVSAGLKPQKAEDAAAAIDTLRLFKIDMSTHVPRYINSVVAASFDRVIALDNRVALELGNVLSDKLLIWNIRDPWGYDDSKYLECAIAIKREILKLKDIIDAIQKEGV